MSTQEKKPKYWELRVLAAYLFMATRKATVASVAKQLRRTERTIYNWRSDPSWKDARAEAIERWLPDFADLCLGTTMDAVRNGNAQIAWDGVQRLVDALAPKSKHEHSGPGGKPIEHEHTQLTDAELVERAKQQASRIAQLQKAGLNGNGNGRGHA